jgi:hypothetical protein
MAAKTSRKDSALRNGIAAGNQREQVTARVEAIRKVFEVGRVCENTNMNEYRKCSEREKYANILILTKTESDLCTVAM